MRNHFRLFLFIVLFIPFCTRAQTDSLYGYWEGKIAAGTDSLTLVLVVENQADSLRVLLDSPDQFVTDIPVDSYYFAADTVRFSIKKLALSFVGTRQKERIRGRFTQYGRKQKMVLLHTAKRKTFPRPQEPIPPYPYREIELTFPYDAARPPITGTLTLPDSTHPQATVILLSGSGRQDRDEAIFGHRPFKVLADHLTRAGFAVFRYDDPPYATFSQQNTLDFAYQAQVVFDTLSTRKELVNSKIGLLGHSEGGMTAWIVAAQNPNVAFVVSLAGMGIPIRDILLYQTHAIGLSIGLPEAQLASNQYVNKAIYTIVEKSKTKKVAQRRLETFFNNYTRAMTDEQRQTAHFTDKDIAAMQAQLLSDWLFTLFHLRPVDYLTRVKCPVLALNGTLDMQVPAQANLSAIRAGLKRSPSITCEEVAGVNHLFQECQTGAVQEYGEIAQTISPQVLATITAWLLKHCAMK